jgi:hypothetical protein
MDEYIDEDDRFQRSLI